MTEPLALLVYENLLPGSQLTNRLRDLGYRVTALTEPAQFVALAEAEKPMVVIIDLFSSTANICELIGQLKANPATQHLPVLGFTGAEKKDLQAQAQAAGANLVASDGAILEQLPQLLDAVLDIK
jgi:PleD family two-component response regulator